MDLRKGFKAIALASALLLGGDALAAGGGPAEPETIKVGILHSLYGTMAISETSLKDELLMLISAQNRKGGLLGRTLEPVVMDPASDAALAAQKARALIEDHQAAAVFGCWTSDCRKAVLPVVEELNALLFYPAPYEGQESSRNIIYTGATPNQQVLPAVDYLIEAHGVERWVLLGSDDVYSSMTNTILQAYLDGKGVGLEDILVRYTALGETQWQGTVAEIVAFGAQGQKTAVLSTVNGDANLFFYKELARAQVDSAEIPVLAFSIGEEEIAGIDAAPLAGHMAAWSYFMSVDHPDNRSFIKQWQNFAKNPRRVTKGPMEAHFIGFSLWVKAVVAAGTTETDVVLDRLIGLSVPNLTGGKATLLPNHHITKPAFVGEIRDDGQFEVTWRSPGMIEADPWSDYATGSRNLISDWREPVACGRFNRVTRVCEEVVGQ